MDISRLQRFSRLSRSRGGDGRFLALIEPGTFLPFDREVPRLVDGRPLETALQDEFGAPKKGGEQQRAVRPLPEADFGRIVDLGLPDDLEAIEERRYQVATDQLDDSAAPFKRPILERLLRRSYRDVAFRRKVREAYGYRCAISGLELRNGGGRPEVQAAHIRPVEAHGSDSVRNGLALSGTLHWMFDRGLISVDPKNFRVLVSHNKVPADVVNRLILPDQTLRLPKDKQDWPHPKNLQWHREHRFGQVDIDLGKME